MNMPEEETTAHTTLSPQSRQEQKGADGGGVLFDTCGKGTMSASVRPPGKYKCAECEMRFTAFNKLEAHMTTHVTGIGMCFSSPFICLSVCHDIIFMTPMVKVSGSQ